MLVATEDEGAPSRLVMREELAPALVDDKVEGFVVLATDEAT